MKKIRRLTEQQWKKKRETKELKESLGEETKNSRRVLKRRRNEANQKINESTYISNIIEKCRWVLQGRKEEITNIPNVMGNMEESRRSPNKISRVCNTTREIGRG
jgi:hypothetical protein